MPTRPTVAATFATDPTITSGAQAGLSTRLDPGPGARAQGFYQDRRMPARAFSYLLGIIGDWISYFDPIVTPFASGGTVAPTGNLDIESTPGNTVVLNGSVFYPAASGGGIAVLGTSGLNVTNGLNVGTTAVVSGTLTVAGAIRANGYCYAPIPISQGPVTAGTWSFVAATIALVFNAAATAAGVIWKIDGTGALQGTTIRFTQASPTNNITLQNPSGVTIATLSASSGGLMAISVALIGSTWTIVDYSVHP